MKACSYFIGNICNIFSKVVYIYFFVLFHSIFYTIFFGFSTQFYDFVMFYE